MTTSDKSRTFRDVGVLPVDLAPPSGPIRGYFSPGRVLGQYIATGLVSSIALALILGIVWAMPISLKLLGSGSVALGFGALVYLATRHDYRWVELDGNTLRARHLYTGRIIERSIGEIERLDTMVHHVRSNETIVAEYLLGRVRGIEIRFKDGRTPLRIMRADPAMTNARELIEAVACRMSQAGQLDYQVVDFNGRPLVRSIHYAGQTPGKIPGNGAIVTLICLMMMGLTFGAILGFWGAGENERFILGSVPPRQISVRELIEKGPGANRYITLTDFRAGGFAYESQNERWTQAWIVLFPNSPASKNDHDIKVVVSSGSVQGAADIARLLAKNRVTGICSKSLRTTWGTTLGPNIVKANPGCVLSSAWSVEEMREPPTRSTVDTLFTGSSACFGVVVVLSIVFFRKATR